MTQRRKFLQALGTLPFASVAPVRAQMNNGHAAMGGTAMMGGAHTAGAKLAAVDALPSGAALQELSRLHNTSTRAGLFRAQLVAAPVKLPLVAGRAPTEFWAYNDSLPGPLIEVMEGDVVEIHFENRLPQPTTVHWHGLPVPSDQDGNPHDAVAPGGKRTYRFTLPKGSAGTYWYHPHPHGHTPEQVYRGLAGTFVVRSQTDPLQDMRERQLVFSDLKLQEDGQIAPSDANDIMNGREGQFELVNGQRMPSMVFDASGREHWRIWNANSARYLLLTLPGTSWSLVGTDGGLLQAPVQGGAELLIPPASRVQLVVDAGAAKGRVSLSTTPYQRGKMGMVPPESAMQLLMVDFSQVSDAKPQPLPGSLRHIAALGRVSAKKRVVFSEQMSMAGGVHAMRFLVNGKHFDMRRTDLTSRVNAVELWEIANEADMDHPFHIHGTQFQVVEREFEGKVVPEPFLAWRDIVNLRSGEIVRFKIVQRMKGLRMFHCHILEHEGAGMMGQLMVV